jgi:hypothetical protein
LIKVLEISKKIYGDENIEYGKILHELAIVLNDLEEYDSSK